MRLRPLMTAAGILLLLHLYIGARLLPALDIATTGTAVGIFLLLCSWILMPLGMLTRSFKHRPMADRIAWLAFLTMGLFSSFFVLTLLRDVTLLATYWLLAPRTYGMFMHTSALAVCVMALLATLVGFLNARRNARVVRIDIPISGLPQPLHGFSIVQVSDVHVGPTIKRSYVDAIVNTVNELNADVIALTGDLVDGSVGQLKAHVAPFARLSARHGCYFVTGNHEYYSGERDWSREFARLGMNVLKNEHVVIHHDNATIVIAGVTDYSAHHFDPHQRSDPSAALQGAPMNPGAKILLAHQPRSAAAASSAGFDLQLSGHTHGGQFWPWNLFVRFQQPFTAGLHRLDRLWVYTSRGTGYWGPPKRICAPSEITRIRLVPA